MAPFLADPTSLEKKVSDYQNLCLPDVFLDEIDYTFEGAATVVAGNSGDRVILRTATGGYAFARWARSQLLTRVGTREKWFTPVDVHTAATELNLRKKSLSGQRLRARTVPGSDVHLVRGMVSRLYSDLPDTTVVSVVSEITQNAYSVLRGGSTKSETSLYCYLVSPSYFHIAGTDAYILCGALVRNSEVGYTSLWVTPFHAWIYPDASGKVTRSTIRIACQASASVRKPHRGLTDSEIRSFLKTALDNSPLQPGVAKVLKRSLAALAALQYSDEEAALAAGLRGLRTVGAPTTFMRTFEARYRAAGHVDHTGVTVYETVLSQCSDVLGADDAYKASAIAGALHLVLT